MKIKKALFIGGIKSGKSLNAETYTLKNSLQKPIYLATTEFIDDEMQKRIDSHKLQRSVQFETIEEPLNLYNTIAKCESSVLIECVSIWINNMLYHGFGFDDMKRELDAVLALDKTVVFVLNDVGCGIIPDNALAREFIDISGKLSQLIASSCDEVYHTVAGISTRIK
ncbi:bifunctional adenosylcobinamide kinase/adenosylcobinamide-phosphate guanylyltransferase [Sulfurimonas sp.]|jgi:adenosylcobinamide kinase/adenosylcobinamide-phosphate guanylyltransferase|uniref:bifunctional adenosylcobinamide kinase/adenosylcobinamide-phosphate guanylyltransferase n=1 Tax=Sulfurimonas sp. TaxID=2022749 RepID=UPI002A36693D|nr:bifunctional adenosylcobinamide kinase/adenosylcobinamide-phosphate guanylyltransferase [Sulfurimonas sp.]MDY0122709.1 bifunctional adenosylcobinamide kinase/adenosylcobinamide-phosphate guanylyltransferase [Sulfurimonas sp.]